MIGRNSRRGLGLVLMLVTGFAASGAAAQGRPPPMVVSPNTLQGATVNPLQLRADIAALQKEVAELRNELNALKTLDGAFQGSQTNAQASLAAKLDTLQTKFAGHSHYLDSSGMESVWVYKLDCTLAGGSGGAGYNCQQKSFVPVRVMTGGKTSTPK